MTNGFPLRHVLRSALIRFFLILLTVVVIVPRVKGQPQPNITSVSPTSVYPGQQITITGTNFGSTAGTVAVGSGSTWATCGVNSWSATQVVATVAPTAEGGNVFVYLTTSAGTQSNSFSLTVWAPNITSVSPTTVAAGQQITITGTNLGSAPGTVEVGSGTTWGNSPVISWSATQVVATVAPTAEGGNVFVYLWTSAGAPSNLLSLTVWVPYLSSVNPTSVAAGQQITLHGTNFGSAAGVVEVGAGSSWWTCGVTSWSSTQAVATVPPEAQGGYVYIWTAAGAPSNPISLTVLVPNITSVSPTSVYPGQQITVTGTNFGSATGTVTVGNYVNWWQCQVTSWSGTQAVATVPLDAQGTEVYVTTQLGAMSNLVSLTVLAPTITSISPTSGAAGTQVTITGANFKTTQGSSTVTFGAIAASPTSWSNTSISVPAPQGVMTGYVWVTISGAASNGVIFRAPTSNFTPTGSLNTARWLPMATLLNNGLVLIAGGADDNWNGLSGESLYNSSAGTFTSTGNLNTPRGFGTATLLANGQVLVTGGWDTNGNTLASAELYNPAAGTFTVVTSPMTAARAGHTAVLLPNGNVLIVGGYDQNGNPLSSAELYNPAAGTFTAITGQLSIARAFPTATLLPNGLVLIAGGLDINWNGLANADLYNPATGNFTPTGNLQTARGWSTATLLNTGQVLMAGGYDSNGDTLASAELYAPATGTFTATGSLNTGRVIHAASLLNNGKVLIVGGSDENGDPLSSAELYDPVAATFTVAGSMNDMRIGPAAIRLINGQVLIAAGMDEYPGLLATAELYQLATLTPAGLQSITLTPLSPSIALGTSQQFVATGTFSGNGTQTLQSATWSTSNSSIATVRNDASDYGEAYAVAAGTVTVTACAGSVCGSTGLTVTQPAPSIASLSPTFGAPGTPVIITGTYFGATQGSSTVTFNGTAGTPTNWSATSISVPVPAGATTGNVVVTVNNLSSNGMSFTVSPPVVSLTSSLNLSTYRRLVAFTATVEVGSNGPTPTGTVTFSNGGTAMGIVTLSSGSATLPPQLLPVGSYSITAAYSGDSNYGGSMSPVLTQTVNAPSAPLPPNCSP